MQHQGVVKYVEQERKFLDSGYYVDIGESAGYRASLNLNSINDYNGSDAGGASSDPVSNLYHKGVDAGFDASSNQYIKYASDAGGASSELVSNI